jgi:hypothetical protein
MFLGLFQLLCKPVFQHWTFTSHSFLNKVTSLRVRYSKMCIKYLIGWFHMWIWLNIWKQMIWSMAKFTQTQENILYMHHIMTPLVCFDRPILLNVALTWIEYVYKQTALSCVINKNQHRNSIVFNATIKLIFHILKRL